MMIHTCPSCRGAGVIPETQPIKTFKRLEDAQTEAQGIPIIEVECDGQKLYMLLASLDTAVIRMINPNDPLSAGSVRPHQIADMPHQPSPQPKVRRQRDSYVSELIEALDSVSGDPRYR